MSNTFMLAINSLRANIVRSLLTMLGIIIGVASMVSVISLGNGGKTQIKGELSRFGINKYWIYASLHNSTLRSVRLTSADADYLKKKLQSAQVCPAAYATVEVRAGQKTAMSEIVGTDNEYQSADDPIVEYGRFLKSSDVKDKKYVAVISPFTAERLFGKQWPVGKDIMIAGRSFAVVGIEKRSKYGIAEGAISGRTYIPLTSFQEIFGVETIDEIAITTANTQDVETLGSIALKEVEKRHNAGAFRSINLAKEMEQADEILNVFTLVVGAIAAISLLVGGIGIMNMMLTTVRERTNEIGVRKALGATDMQVMMQFLSEALLCAGIGSLCGLLLSFGFTAIFSKMADFPAPVSTGAVVVSVAVALFLGLFFGMYPALKAAKMDPVEALRKD